MWKRALCDGDVVCPCEVCGLVGKTEKADQETRTEIEKSEGMGKKDRAKPCLLLSNHSRKEPQSYHSQVSFSISLYLPCDNVRKRRATAMQRRVTQRHTKRAVQRQRAAHLNTAVPRQAQQSTTTGFDNHRHSARWKPAQSGHGERTAARRRRIRATGV